MDYKLIHEVRTKSGSSSYTVTRNVVPVTAGNINVAGSRAVDNAKFQITGGHKINPDDVVTFIVDDVPADNLAFAYNFYYNLRDEAGWNIDGYRIDGDNIPFYGTEGYGGSRYQGHRYLNCTSSTQVIRCKQSDRENNKDKINFDNGREIHLHIQIPTLTQWGSSDSKQIIFSRIDSNSGIEIGLSHVASEDKTYAFLRQRVYNGSSASETETTNSSALLVSDSSNSSGHAIDCYIRVRKLEDLASMGGRYSRTEILVNEKTYGSYLYNSSGNILTGGDYKFEQANTTKDIYLCSDSSSGNKFKGKLYACYGWNAELNVNESLSMWKRLLPQSTMKFGGRVSDVVENDGKVYVNVVGFSGILLKTELNETFMDNSGSLNNKGMYVFNNESGTTNNTKTLMENIVNDAINGYNNKLETQGVDLSNGHLGKDIKYEFQFINTIAKGGLYDDEDDGSANSTTGLGQPTTNSTHARNIDKYDIGGRFIDTIRILSTLGAKQYRMDGANVDDSLTLDHLYGADQFHMLPRKVLVFESSEIPNKSYFSSNNGYRIENEGYDDSNIVTEVGIFAKPRYTTVRLLRQNTDAGKTYPAAVDGGTSGIFNLEYYMAYTNNDRRMVDLEKITIKEVGTDERELSSIDDYTYSAGKIDWDSGLGTNSQTALYIYVKVIDTTDDSQYYTIKNQPVIKSNGLKSRKYLVPQMNDLTTTVYLAQRILGSKSEPEQQFTLTIPRMVNALGVGMKTTIDHGGKGIYNKEVVVKSISYYFPNGKTIVQCGDFAYDVMDDISMINENLASFQNERVSTS